MCFRRCPSRSHILAAGLLLVGCSRSHASDGEHDLYRAPSCVGEPTGDPSALLTLSIDGSTTRFWETDASGERRELYATDDPLPLEVSWRGVSPDGRFMVLERRRYRAQDRMFVVDLLGQTHYALHEEYNRRYGEVDEEMVINFEFRPDSGAILATFFRPDDRTHTVKVEIDLRTWDWTEVDAGCGIVRYARDGSCRIYRRRDACAGHSVEIIDVDRSVVNALEEDVAYLLPGQRGAVVYEDEVTNEGDTRTCGHAPRFGARGHSLNPIFCDFWPTVSRDGRVGVQYDGAAWVLLDYELREASTLEPCVTASPEVSPTGDAVSCSSGVHPGRRTGVDLILLDEGRRTLSTDTRLRLAIDREETQVGWGVDAFSRDGRRYLLVDGMTADERDVFADGYGVYPQTPFLSEFFVYSTDDGRLLQEIPLMTEFGFSIQTEFRYPGYRP